jgi:hypothetical protein
MNFWMKWKPTNFLHQYLTEFFWVQKILKVQPISNHLTLIINEICFSNIVSKIWILNVAFVAAIIYYVAFVSVGILLSLIKTFSNFKVFNLGIFLDQYKSNNIHWYIRYFRRLLAWISDSESSWKKFTVFYLPSRNSEKIGYTFRYLVY